MSERGKVKWYLRPMGVVLLLFFVLGPLGLPLLYKSPSFGKRMKVILTVAVLVYTSFLILSTVEIGKKLHTMVEEYQDRLK